MEIKIFHQYASFLAEVKDLQCKPCLLQHIFKHSLILITCNFCAVEKLATNENPKLHLTACCFTTEI
jgi:ribosomal protein S27E